jgi:6-pyruvoyltetrahydropterin/6-carboxytetrahydropterin synthase
MKTAVYRKAHFNAAHRLHNPNWTQEKNMAVFGKCNNPHFHGHNYELVVKVTGEIDAESGYVVDMKVLKELIDEKIIDKLDHKNLNIEVEEFAHLNPTAENIAVIIWNILSHALPAHLEVKVILYETERNFVEYPA